VRAVGFLAVPVGGCRLGRHLSLSDVVTGLAVPALLDGRRGFPHVRLRWSPYRDTCHVVAWGARAPIQDDPETQGWFYGYSAEAIARLLRTERSSTAR
jgi:hypothetical protein